MHGCGLGGASRGDFLASQTLAVPQVWMYALGKTLAVSPLSLLNPLAFAVPFHTLVNPMASFSTFYWIFLCTGLAGEGLGILISVAFPETRQVAGGVAALATSMFTGCFPLFTDAGGVTRGIGSIAFLRYSAQLLFRAEYLAFSGLGPAPLCAAAGRTAAYACLAKSDYFGSAFWLPAADAQLGPSAFAACPLPWEIGPGGNPFVTPSAWDSQCCGVNLFLQAEGSMRDNYGYLMHPDYSFLKLTAFALVFRILAVLVLQHKDAARRR